MCSCCNNICIWYRVHMKSCCHKTCDMCHIYHKICAYLVSYLSEFCKIDFSRICTCTCYDKLWFILFGNLKHVIIVYISIIIYTIWNNVKIFSWNIYRWTMCKMSSVCKAHTHNCVTRINQCKEYGKVSLSAWMWLYIYILTSK